jgi:hypothetical protein
MDEESSGDLQIDRTQFSVVRLKDQDDAVAFWLTRPVVERLRALEQLRRTFYGARATERLQQVLEVSTLEGS